MSIFHSLDFCLHQVDATQWMGWGGVGGMLTFLELAHMLDATQWMGWGGWDVNVP